MRLRNSFTVPVPVDEAWRVFLDIERVVPCLPGAVVEGFDGETINGALKVRVGPIIAAYRGTATFQQKDEPAHRIVLAAHGRNVHGPGTVSAIVTGTLVDRDGGTGVTLVTDLTITGRPAQCGRGVMTEVGDKLIGRFADCLSQRLAGTQRAAGRPGEPSVLKGAVVGPGGGEAAVVVGTGALESEPIDLLRTAGGPVAIRVAAVLLVTALAAALTAILIHRARLIRGKR
jgi:carbon monoxide dehydrogenase subunit G